ncbi:hypothetical protein [Streptomyces rishiriensis]|uniref:Lipoprotein n=1 Tax=Streptomyces rishiriensis TaxID=68264 RepID=A0ABU0NGH6_STRRH|nr:hypothetical protein [Streptomyces rishiriensis]MDQ0578212.1 hypothetical protein [Streptomyces rishiriensis]
MSHARITACAVIAMVATLTMTACGADSEGSPAKIDKKDAVAGSDSDTIVPLVPAPEKPDSGDNSDVLESIIKGIEKGAPAVIEVCTDIDRKGLCSDSIPFEESSLVGKFYAAKNESTGEETSVHFNDKISYIDNRTDHRICFYENTEFGGEKLTIDAHEKVNSLNPSGDDTGVNDEISSLKPC